jgi:hypothetical protein
VFKIKYTKKQIFFTLIVAFIAALAWRSFDIFLFFDGLFWNYYTKVFPHHNLAGLVRDISKEIIFPAVVMFSILYSVKIDMNFLKISLCFVLGFLFSYALLQLTSNGGINYFWASDNNMTWKPRTFIQLFKESENLFYDLLQFTPFIFWIAACGIRIIVYLKSKKNTIIQEGTFKSQYFSFAIIYLALIMSLSLGTIAMYIRQTQDLLDVIWLLNIVAFFKAGLLISTILLAYITYVKKIPVSLFGISLILVFLIRALFIFFIPTIEIFPIILNDIILSAFIFFAIESPKKYLIIVSILSFMLIPLFYTSNFTTIYEGVIILGRGGVIYLTMKNNLYSILFILPITIAFYINDRKFIKSKFIKA